MADVLTSLAIESISNSQSVKVSKDINDNTVNNPIYVQIVDADGDSISIDASGNLVTILAANDGVDIGDVDVASIAAGTNTIGKVYVTDGVDDLQIVTEGGAVEATPKGIQILTDDGTNYVGLQSNASGDLKVTLDSEVVSVTISDTKVDDAAFGVGTDKVFPSGFLVDEATTDSADEGDVGIARMTPNRILLVSIDDISRGTQTNDLKITLDSEIVQVSKDTNANSETNPIFVQNVNSIVSAIEVIDYDKADSVVTLASSNHDYSVSVGKTLKVEEIIIASSGAMKAEVQAGPIASLVSKATAFTSQANQTYTINFKGLLEVPDTSTGTLRIIRTNRERQTQDLYSTIIGVEV